MKSLTKETPLENTLAFCLLLVMTVPVILWKGYVLSVIYFWYAPSEWPMLSLRAAIGLSFIVNMLVFRATPKDDHLSCVELLGRAIVFGLIGPLLSLGFARVVLWFV